MYVGITASIYAKECYIVRSVLQPQPRIIKLHAVNIQWNR